jgi:oligopeptide transport system permease protein
VVAFRPAGHRAAMLAFVLRRALWTVPVILVVVTAIFFLMRSIGGDPFRHGPLVGLTAQGQGRWVKYGDWQPPGIRRAQRHRYGLDLPWYEQYANFLEGVARFDYGPSLSYRDRSVNEILEERAPTSLELGLLAFVWAFGLGIPLGVLAALRHGSALDTAVRLFTSVDLALPAFLIGTLLVYVFSVKLGLLPTHGWNESWRHKVLPSFALGLLPLAVCTRLARAATLETLQAEYVTAARARGLRRRRVVGAHVLRNSLVPVVTAAGPMLGYLVTGSFVIELVFSVPGISRFYVASVLARDYTVVLGITVLLALLIIVANLIVDVIHGLLDPRIREARA